MEHFLFGVCGNIEKKIAQKTKKEFQNETMALGGVIRSKKQNLKGKKEHLIKNIYDMDDEIFREMNLDEDDLSDEFDYSKIERLEPSPLKSGLQIMYEHSKDYPLLTKEEEVMLLSNLTPENKDLLILSNIRLVIKAAYKRARYSPTPVEDLAQEGFMGLIRTIDKFDVTKGVKLSTYATPWIHHYMRRYDDENRDTIRIPVNHIAKINLLNKVENSSDFNGKKIEKKDVMEICNCSEKVATSIIKYRDPVARIDSEFAPEVSSNKLVEDEVFEEDFSDQISNIIEQSLSDEEMQILYKRFGLGDSDRMSCPEIAKEMDITKEKVASIEKRALNILKENPDMLTLFTSYVDESYSKNIDK